MTELDQTAFQLALQSEWKIRRLSNPGYSLRSFARNIDLSPASLSEILNGKRRVSSVLARRVCAKLFSSPEKQSSFLQEIGFAQNSKGPSGKDTRFLDPMTYQIVASWQHFALLSLLECTGPTKDIEYLSTALGISPEITEKALDRLLKAKLIKMKTSGYVPTHAIIASTEDIPSSAIQRSHRESLELAARSLSEIDVELREFQSITLSFDPGRMKRAKNLIRKFRDRFIREMEIEPKTSVYRLCIQLFPLTRGGLS